MQNIAFAPRHDKTFRGKSIWYQRKKISGNIPTGSHEHQLQCIQRGRDPGQTVYERQSLYSERQYTPWVQHRNAFKKRKTACP